MIDHPASLSAAQINALRCRTMRDVLCQNSYMEQAQVNVFLPDSSETNPVVSCGTVNDLDIDLF